MYNRFQENLKLLVFQRRLTDKEILLVRVCPEKNEPGWLDRLRRQELDAFAEFVVRFQQDVFLCCEAMGLKPIGDTVA